MDNELLSNLEKSFKGKRRFNDIQTLFGRYSSIKETADKEFSRRDKIVDEYERKPTIKNGKKNPNFGQLKGRVDDLIQILFDASTERGEIFKISLKKIPDKKLRPDKLSIEDRVTSLWHEIFWNTWETRWQEEGKDIKDVALFHKAVRFFEDGCYRAVSVPITRVYPDSNAGIDPSTWDYCFVEKRYSLAELYDIFQEDESESIGWNKNALEHILTHPYIFSQKRRGSQEAFYSGDVNIDTDYEIILIDAYVKEYKKNEVGNRISVYTFPADPIFCSLAKSKEEYQKYSGDKFHLNEFVKYSNRKYKCFTEKFAVRTTDNSYSYWKCASFAEQIYPACVFYNEAMNLVIRASIRNSILWLKSDKQETKDKIRNLGTEEVQVLDPGVDLLQTRVKTDVRELTEIVRQAMIDTDAQFNVGSTPGSQNVKGYAITAKEAENIQFESTKSKSVTVKTFFGNDVRLYRRMFEVSLDDSGSEDEDKSELRKIFFEELSLLEIPKSLLSPENITVTPIFNLQAISPTNRIAKSRGLVEALMFQPTTKGQQEAQREWVAAFVGSANVQYYIDKKDDIIDLQQKVGGENEDMDNPYLNPQNIPISPNDKHILEIPIHLADYEFKLKLAQNIIQNAQQLSPVRKVILINTAKDIVEAQDNKGGHIEAHIAAASSDERNIPRLKPLVDKFNQIRKVQDSLAAEIEKVISEFDSQSQESNGLTMEEQHKQRMNDLEFNQAQRMNDLDLRKAIEKRDGTQIAREDKLQHQRSADALKQQREGIKSQNDIEAQKQKAAIDIAKEEMKLHKQQQKKNEQTN